MFAKQKNNYKEHIMNILPCIAGGAWCGALVGVSVFFFRLLAEGLIHISKGIYSSAANSPTSVAIIFVMLLVGAVAMLLLHRFIPDVRGGGIPRSKGSAVGILRLRWLRTLLGTVGGSYISFACGLPLGTEGPSVLIGTSLGSFCGGSFKDKEAWRRFMMTGGAGAGFAVATGAPLAAILFVLEEIHRRISPLLLITLSSSVLTAAMINDFLCRAFGLKVLLFDFGIIEPIRLSHVGYLLLLAIILAVSVTAFDLLMAYFNDLVKRINSKLLNVMLMVALFALTGVLGIFMPETIYGGTDIIANMLERPALMAAAMLLLIRVGFMLLSTSSGATGGIFVPTLAIGAVIGSLCATLLVKLGMPSDLYGTIVLLSMSAFMGGTMRIPLTATVFFIESTGQFSNILYVMLVTFIVAFGAEAINSDSFYETTLTSLKNTQNEKSQPSIVRFEMTVSGDSFVTGKALRDIIWPPSSVITGINHTGSFKTVMDEAGDQVLRAGDKLTLQAEIYDLEETEKYLYSLVGEEHKIIHEII